jgi:hypothetical protein
VNPPPKTSPEIPTVSRANPGCYIFLLDQSRSMDDPIGGTNVPKKVALANAVNYYLNELIAQCEKGEPQPRHYYDIALVGYTTDETTDAIEVGPAFQGALAANEGISMDFVGIPELSENALGTTDVNGATILYWYEPVAKCGTPMAAGLEYCRRLAEWWASAHPDSVPPIVVHITDGEPSHPTDDPEAAAEAEARMLRSVGTKKGSALLFNIHLSERDAPLTIFPSSEDELADDLAKMLFRMSSELPDFCLTMARAKGWKIEAGARGMAFNTDATALVNLLSIGTVVDAQAQRKRDPRR